MSTRHHIHETTRLREKAADTVASFVGSWSFVAIMTTLMAGWIIWNVCPFLPHFDPPEFILLNLCLSFIAGYTGPFVMMSQNRQSARDRKRDDHEAHVVDGTASLIKSMSTVLNTMAEDHKLLVQVNQQSLQHSQELLQLQKVQMEMLETLKPKPARKREVQANG